MSASKTGDTAARVTMETMRARRARPQEGLTDAIGSRPGFDLREHLIGFSKIPVCWNQKAPEGMMGAS